MLGLGGLGPFLEAMRTRQGITQGGEPMHHRALSLSLSLTGL